MFNWWGLGAMCFCLAPKTPFTMLKSFFVLQGSACSFLAF